jgi:hypothetical protein
VRSALAVMALMLSTSALAQFAEVRGPERATIATPFDIEIFMYCPPPGEAPPPRNCRGHTAVRFEVSDRSGRYPHDPVALVPNATVASGPFVFHKPGWQYITLFSFEDDVVGVFSVLVQHPAARSRR